MRRFAYGLVLWHFVLLPALCHSGLLEHFCPEDRSEVCSHEEACDSDPCAVDVALPARSGGTSDPSSPVVVPNLTVASLPDDLEVPASSLLSQTTPAPGDGLRCIPLRL